MTHDHGRQYQFAIQTLTLWREVQNDMFKLWCLAEDDLLDPDNYYSLRDTGQVINYCNYIETPPFDFNWLRGHTLITLARF